MFDHSDDNIYIYIVSIRCLTILMTTVSIELGLTILVTIVSIEF